MNGDVSPPMVEYIGKDRRMRINVAGALFVVSTQTLLKHPNTKLGMV